MNNSATIATGAGRSGGDVYARLRALSARDLRVFEA
jgi:hypothetical protein